MDVARSAEDLSGDPVLVVIDDDVSTMTADEWLALLAGDEPSEVDADAADIIRDIREHGER